jgi:hypothetical protein
LIHFFDVLFRSVGTFSIAIVSLMPIYLVIKNKSLNAIAYWCYASKKELLVIRFGYIGFIVAAATAIISANLANC